MTAIERRQEADVRDHPRGLVEGADQVLRARMVRGYLASHRPIHLGEQRRRQVDVLQAAHVRAGDPAAEVVDHAAAKRHDEVSPADVRGGQPVPQLERPRRALAGLAWRKPVELIRDLRLIERFPQGGAVEVVDAGVGDDRQPRAGGENAQVLDGAGEAACHVDRIDVFAKRARVDHRLGCGQREFIADSKVLSVDGAGRRHGSASSSLDGLSSCPHSPPRASAGPSGDRATRRLDSL